MEAADKETSGSNLEKETTSFNQGDNEGVNQELGNTVTTETMSSSHQHQEDDNEYADLLQSAIEEKIRELENTEAIKEKQEDELRRAIRKRDYQGRNLGNLIENLQNLVDRATEKVYLLQKKIYELENERDELLKKTANAIDQQITRDDVGVNMMEDDSSEASGLNNNLADSDFFNKLDDDFDDSDIYSNNLADSDFFNKFKDDFDDLDIN